MDKNQTSKIVATVAAGLSTVWTNYKRTARRQHDPMGSFIYDLFNIEVNDVQGAAYLAKDVERIRNNRRTMKTRKQFNDIIKNEF